MNDQINNGGLVHNMERFGGEVESYYISSVKLPTVKVKADEFKRDSRPYMMPGFDEPLTEIGITFLMDSPVDSTTSKVYRFLEMWRAFVRAGRGAMGNERSVSQLGVNFRVNFRFPAVIYFLRGCLNPKLITVADISNEYYGNLDDLNTQLAGLTNEEKSKKIGSIMQNAGVNARDYPLNNDLETCAVFSVERMWLSSFRISDIDYSKGNETAKIEAAFCADSITDLNNKAT